MPGSFVLAVAHTGTSFGSVVAVIAGIAAAAGGLAAAVQSGLTSVELRTILKQLRETAPERVVEPLDFNAIGAYLYETVGGVALGAYAARPDARQDVVRALSEVEEFLDRDVPVAAASVNVAVDSWFAQAKHALDTDDTWTALASLRRSLEIELRARLEASQVPLRGRPALNQIIRAALSAGLLTQGLAIAAQQTAAIANRAVHGDPVDDSEAAAAMEMGGSVLAYLQAHPVSTRPETS